MAIETHRYYPVFLDLAGRQVLIIGGGEVASRKIETMLRCDARITVVARDAVSEISELAIAGRIRLMIREYRFEDLEGQFVVIAATSDMEINKRVAEDARRRKVLVNVVDDPQLCDFIVPAIFNRGQIQVAVSTGGSSPALARVVRARLESVVTPALAELAEILGDLRPVAKAALDTDDDRKRFFGAVVDSDVLDLLQTGHRREAFEALRQLCLSAGVTPPEEKARRDRQ